MRLNFGRLNLSKYTPLKALKQKFRDKINLVTTVVYRWTASDHDDT